MKCDMSCWGGGSKYEIYISNKKFLVVNFFFCFLLKTTHESFECLLLFLSVRFKVVLFILYMSVPFYNVLFIMNL